MKLLIRILIMGSLIFLGCRHQTVKPNIPPHTQISPRLFKQHLFFLGDDSLRGRSPGTPGIDIAAAYIAKQLEMYGILPAGEHQTYFQHIPLHLGKILPSTRLQLFMPDSAMQLQLNKDYLINENCGEIIIPNPVQLVFVGYGIIAPEYDYNDYIEVDVNGKIVVFLQGEPWSEDPDFFDGEKQTYHSTTAVKFRKALSRGALGGIMILNPRLKEDNAWKEWVKSLSFKNISLAYRASGNIEVILNPAFADTLFYNELKNFSEIIKMDKMGSIFSFPMHKKITFYGNYSKRDFYSKNVIGYLPASGSSETIESVLLSAHYDHLGIGYPVLGDSIYNGVFDNAAGVACLLEIARYFASITIPLKKNIIFLFTTAEESGLLGSRYYTDFPVFPLYKTVANINIDGVSMFDQINSVVMLGAEHTNLDKIFHHYMGDEISIDPIEPSLMNLGAFQRSDHFAFARAGIPAISIIEGMNYRNTSFEDGYRRMYYWNKYVYHTPFDDLHQYISLAAAQQYTEIVADFCYYLVNGDQQPEWESSSPYLLERLRSKQDKR